MNAIFKSALIQVTSCWVILKTQDSGPGLLVEVGGGRVVTGSFVEVVVATVVEVVDEVVVVGGSVLVEVVGTAVVVGASVVVGAVVDVVGTSVVVELSCDATRPKNNYLYYIYAASS